MTTYMLLALLHLFIYRSPVQVEYDAGGLVRAVYAAGGLDAVAVVSMESNFNPRAERREPRGHTSYGLFQLDDEWHRQYRGNLSAHIAEGARFLEECKKEVMQTEARKENNRLQLRGSALPDWWSGPDMTGVAVPGNRKTANFSSIVARYNGGTHPGRQARAWGKKVEVPAGFAGVVVVEASEMMPE